jgi:peptide/nickel transport system substrate-binding protein
MLLSACAPAATPTPQVVEKVRTVVVKETEVVEKEVVKEVVKEARLRAVPRERTLIYQGGSGFGEWFGIHNPYAAGFHHQYGDQFIWEGLEYYAGAVDEYQPWLAESYEYNADSTELTIKTRREAEWSDGTPFTARDVAFTLNMLKDNAPKLKSSAVVEQYIEEAEAIDDYTVVVKFKQPAPRFWFDVIVLHEDSGLEIVPEHIFKDVEEIDAFRFADLEKGWPVVTGPFNVSYETSAQKFYDRRDDWWAVGAGIAELPEVERIVIAPQVSDENTGNMILSNLTDVSLGRDLSLVGSVVGKNPDVTTYTEGPPHGYVTYWPIGIGWNDLEAPFDNPDIRWAINHVIDREKASEVAYGGAYAAVEWPYPAFKALQPYKEHIRDLLDEYRIQDYDLEKSAALMEKNGYVKDSQGFWSKDGKRFSFEMGGWGIFANIGPVVAEMLRQGGFEVEFTMPPDQSDRISTGRKDFCFWMSPNWSIVDPVATLADMHKDRVLPTGEGGWQNIWRWGNDEFSAIVDDLVTTEPGSPEEYDLFYQAMEIWLRELPMIPLFEWYHLTLMNTTYWTGWPSADNPSHWPTMHYKTGVRVVDGLKAVK